MRSCGLYRDRDFFQKTSLPVPDTECLWKSLPGGMERKEFGEMKKKILIGVTVLIFLGIAVAVSLQYFPENKKVPIKTAVSTSQDIEPAKENQEDNEEKKETNLSEEEAKAENIEENETEETEEENPEGKNPEDSAQKSSQSSDESGGSQSVQVQPSYMSFPFTDESKGVEIQSIEKYSGYFIEDGTDEEVSDVAVIMVKNNSDQVIEYGDLKLSEGENVLEFQFSLLPPGKTALVMEANRNTYQDSGQLLYQQCEIANLGSLSMENDKIQMEFTEDGGINLKNISGGDIASLRIFYKNRLDENTYLGGIAYTAEVQELKIEESRVIYPSHYNKDYGEIMMIRLY